ncbi:MAG TPA: M48 family metallopeptidase [Cytophagaceae bacterium]
MHRVILVILLVLTCQISYSQFEKNYIPIPVTDTIPSDVYDKMMQRLEKDKSLAKSQDSRKDVCKYKCTLYDQRTKGVINRFNKDYFMIDSVFTMYLRKVADKIYDANPQLPRETTIYAYRSAVPNALCFGEGTIAVNLGLLRRLESESQVAFILCHELAHYHLKHSDLHINKLAELNFDKSLKNDIKDISKSEYNQYTRTKELLQGLTFDVTKHSRLHESEADSIGITYLLNTSYNPFEAIRTMEILDSCDVPLYHEILDLKKYFHFEQYPFKDSWLEYEISDYEYAKGLYHDSDTLSTHPDCKKRIVNMNKQLASYSGKKKLPKDPYQAYKGLVQISEFEIIESLYHFKYYGRALYNTLRLLEKYPENTYLNAMVGKCLYHIYQYQSNKEFGKVVDLQDTRYSESYNRFLSFLHNLRLTEMSKICTMYMEQRSLKYGEDEEFLYALILSSQLPTTGLFKEKMKQNYQQKYPKGKYINQINKL